MILGKQKNLSRYKGISPLLDQAIEAASVLTAEAAEGKTELCGDKLFYTVSATPAKPKEQGKFEAHRRYADLQVILRGDEVLGIAETGECKVTTPYDESRDIAFMTGEGDFLSLKTGDFYLLFPEDAHMPCCGETGALIKKAVFKVLLD